MCGISGYIGYNAPLKALAITLGQLERGTQGSGVAYICNREIAINKAPVHPARFFLSVYGKLPKYSRIAIAHNRLPSKGKVCFENTHPFLACNREFALVHNGHMFNGNIEAKVKALGHRVIGETDSEILMHWIEELVKREKSIARALLRLEDYNFSGAILLLTKHGKIYGLRDSSHPLLIARKGSTYAIGQTRKAISVVMENPEKIIEPKPFQVVKLSQNGLRLIGKGKEEPKNLDRWLKQYLKNGLYYYL